MDDKTLVELCASKDGPAWESFLSLYSGSIYTSIRRTLTRYGPSPAQETVEDIFGEVLLSLLEDGGRRLLGFEGRNGSRLSTYLWVIASRHTVNHIRKNARDRITETGTNTFINCRDCRELPDAALERKDAEKAKNKILDGLSANDRLFVRLYYEKELSTEEIASIMNISPSAVYSRKNRVREKMQKIFRKISVEEASK